MDAIKQNQIEPEKSARRRCMRLLAQATVEEMRAVLHAILPTPEIFAVRGPETGLVMVRGRIGGGGDPFNLGEATVTRATIRMETGEIGHGQMLGTDKEKARLAAVFDALWQKPERRAVVEALVLAVEERIAAQDRLEAEQTAATRVDFFTMVRGEN